ncbi:hypothetical protein SUGI_0672910 [Cryptomeria japonica]|nr:hypothetical protein SUGI_0672910 [Cryptomeria japonica]
MKQRMLRKKPIVGVNHCVEHIEMKDSSAPRNSTSSMLSSSEAISALIDLLFNDEDLKNSPAGNVGAPTILTNDDFVGRIVFNPNEVPSLMPFDSLLAVQWYRLEVHDLHLSDKCWYSEIPGLPNQNNGSFITSGSWESSHQWIVIVTRSLILRFQLEEQINKIKVERCFDNVFWKCLDAHFQNDGFEQVHRLSVDNEVDLPDRLEEDQWTQLPVYWKEVVFERIDDYLHVKL